MLELYFGPTPNARKISIMLEELGVPYHVNEIDILAGDQFKPEFLLINPNNKMPAIVDPVGPDGNPIAVWETGAILIYLAVKHRRFIPTDARARIECFKWLMFQVSAVGPMAGQFAFFRFYAPEKIPLAIERYERELNRQMRVMDKHLAENAYFAGSEMSIADIAIYPWWATMKLVSIELRPNLERWGELLAVRPGVSRGMTLLNEKLRPEVIEGGMKKKFSEQIYSTLYGDDQRVQGDKSPIAGA
jgi:GSH-dependent disulfide-bond oxidoreductase